MGIYGPHIDIEVQPPIMLLQLCAVLLIANPAEILSSVAMTVVQPSGELLGPPLTQLLEKPLDEASFSHQLMVKLGPFPIPAVGEFKFRFIFNGDEELGVEIPMTVRYKPAEPKSLAALAPISA
jgi:hypothetical protein